MQEKRSIVPIIMLSLFSFVCFFVGCSDKKYSSWEKWSNENAWYFNKMEKIFNDSAEKNKILMAKIADAKEKNDSTLKKEIVRQSIDKDTILIENLEKINPPSELTMYHRKVIEAAQISIKVSEAYLKDDLESVEKYVNDCRKTYNWAVAEKIALYATHKAPKKEINLLRKSLSQ